ncbi:MAG TPA: hypothetical protein VFF63_03075 [Candidatus Babeliales bacterium]|nr:hypothetical protein [Candidatus Babeliales bacterium]
MKKLNTCAAIGIALILFGSTACGGAGGTGGMPAASGAAQAPSAHFNGGKNADNFSGEWSGKFVDSAYGKGKGSASYGQYQTAIGGILSVKYKSGTLTASVVQVASGLTVDGTTIGGSGSLYCSFSTTGTYDPTTHVLAGSYKAVNGCTGETGTFALKHTCYYKGGAGSDIRPQSSPKSC